MSKLHRFLTLATAGLLAVPPACTRDSETRRESDRAEEKIKQEARDLEDKAKTTGGGSERRGIITA